MPPAYFIWKALRFLLVAAVTPMLLQSVGPLLSSPHKLADYHVEVWKTEQGLPQNTVNSLCQTRDGYLWVGTPSGLARFDGLRFKVFDLGRNPEMGDDTSRDLTEGSDGSLWIATNEGLLQWKEHRFRRFTMAEGLPWNGVRSVSANRGGGVWVGTSKGYARYVNGTFTNYYHWHGPIDHRTAVFEDDDGTAWLSSNKGTWRIDPISQQLLPVADESSPANWRATCFHQGLEGKVWFGNHGGLHCWREGRLSSYRRSADSTEDPAEVNTVSAILELRSGEVWVSIGADHVLHRFENNQFVRLAGPAGEPINQVSALLQDREGNIWLGSRYNGLMKLKQRQIQVYSTENGLKTDDIQTVCQTPDGTVWVAGSGGHYSAIRDGHVVNYSLSLVGRNSVVSMCPDRSGHLWFGLRSLESNSLWLHKLERNATPLPGRLVRAKPGFPSRYAQALYEDRAGSLWIGTERGAFELRDGNLSSYTAAHGLPNESVNVFLRDMDGTMWIGTEGGLARIAHDQVNIFDSNNGLSNNSICALYQDAHKCVWIGTRRGLTRYKDGRLATLMKSDGLPDDIASNILQDNQGRFWIGCNRGVYRVEADQLHRAADGHEKVRAVSFGQADGMISSETQAGGQPSAWKASDGRLWFATTKGVAVLDPKTLAENTVEPPVVIEEVVANNRPMYGPGATGSRNADFHLEPGGGRVVEFRYTANSFAAPEKVAFRYRLVGHDENWIEAQDRRVAFYTNLRPGQYRFDVKACNNSGHWNETGASVAFIVAPYFYETRTFYAGCLAAALLTAIAVHRRRLSVSTQIQRLKHERAMEAERARIAQDMHDDLGASLTQVAILSEVARKAMGSPEIAAGHIERISGMARSMVNGITEIIWAIGPRNDRLDSLCGFLREYAAQRCEEAGLACRLQFPPEPPDAPVTAEFRRNLLLILKEALNNLLKHSGASAAEVQLSLRRNGAGDELELVVADNGRGFDASAVSPFQNGLQNMRKRVNKLNGDFVVESAANRGTRIRVQVPLPRHVN